MKLAIPRLYAIMDAALLRTTELAFAEMLAQAGVDLIQYRHKQASSRSSFQSSCALVECLSPRGVKLVVNDRPDIAALAGAAGVHVGQDDLTVEQARAICGPARWVGISTHNLPQFERAAVTSADYIAVGPIFPTRTKQNPDPVVGLDFIHRVRPLTAKPLVAIGGITLENARDVFAAGADSIAVARDLAEAPDPGARAGQFLDLAAQFDLRETGAA